MIALFWALVCGFIVGYWAGYYTRGKDSRVSFPSERVVEEFLRVYNSIVPNERGCMIWPGRMHGNYPYLLGHGAHRIALQIRLGRCIREGFQANHSCGTYRCVSMNHVYEGTQKQNMEDKVKHGRGSFNAGKPGPNRGRKFSDSHRANISKAAQGRAPWNKGKRKAVQ